MSNSEPIAQQVEWARNEAAKGTANSAFALLDLSDLTGSDVVREFCNSHADQIIVTRFHEVLHEEPSLCWSGFFVPLSRTSKQERKGQLRKDREKLFGLVEDVVWMVRWMRSWKLHAIKRCLACSYHLKHLAERSSVSAPHYLPNGVAVVAGIIVGLKFRVDPPNAYFGISRNSIRKITEQGKATGW